MEADKMRNLCFFIGVALLIFILIRYFWDDFSDMEFLAALVKIMTY